MSRRPQRSSFHNDNFSITHNYQPPSDKKPYIAIIGDSIIKNIPPHKLSNNMQALVNEISIAGMKAMELKHYVEPSISKKPDFIILHCCINVVMITSSSPRQIGEELKEVATSIRRRTPTYSIFISGITRQAKYSNSDVNVQQLNNILYDICEKNNFHFIDNSNTTVDDACNFRDCIKA